MSQTNETTQLILKFLFDLKILAWRHNTTGIPLPYGGLRCAAKTGLPDIIGILDRGIFFGCEIKTKKDKLSEVQKGFHLQAKQRGAIIFLVKDFNDFLLQWQNLKRE